MAKDNSTLLLLALGGGALYFMTKNKGTSKRGEVFVNDTEIIPRGSEASKVFEEQTDAVIDAPKSGMSVDQAIAKAQEIAGTLQDAKILIKTGAAGVKKHIVIRKGKKKIKPTAKRRVRRIPSKAKVSKMFKSKKFKTFGYGF